MVHVDFVCDLSGSLESERAKVARLLEHATELEELTAELDEQVKAPFDPAAAGLLVPRMWLRSCGGYQCAVDSPVQKGLMYEAEASTVPVSYTSSPQRRKAKMEARVSVPPALVPPLRFCLVEEGLYRGAYPSLVNLRFLTRLGLRSMVSLLPEPPAPHLVAWCEEHNVHNHYECVRPFSKDEVTLTPERAASLLQLLVLPERHPVYVHCLDGTGVTGMLIMCLRKLMGWASSPILAEYSRFTRDGMDVALPPPQHAIAFLHTWKPELEFLPQHLPARPPSWLDIALQTSIVDGDAPPAVPVKQAERNRNPTMDLFERDRTAAVFPSATAGGDGRDPMGMGTSSSIGLALDALAIEGLTSGPPRHHRAVTRRDSEV